MILKVGLNLNSWKFFYGAWMMIAYISPFYHFLVWPIIYWIGIGRGCCYRAVKYFFLPFRPPKSRNSCQCRSLHPASRKAGSENRDKVRSCVFMWRKRHYERRNVVDFCVIDKIFTRKGLWHKCSRIAGCIIKTLRWRGLSLLSGLYTSLFLHLVRGPWTGDERRPRSIPVVNGIIGRFCDLDLKNANH